MFDGLFFISTWSMFACSILYLLDKLTIVINCKVHIYLLKLHPQPTDFRFQRWNRAIDTYDTKEKHSL